VKRGYAAVVLVMLLSATACRREERKVRDEPARSATLIAGRESQLQPGGALADAVTRSPAEGNAYAVSEGKVLYMAYNCSGCHFHGGGGIGPPLMKPESAFVYGGRPENIFDTISKGRPNGMPSWGARIPEAQIWKIAAFVRSLGGNEPSAATGARSDHMEKKTAAQLQ
jgi:cytochrome c oxidase cbb3-type subunit 3